MAICTPIVWLHTWSQGDLKETWVLGLTVTHTSWVEFVKLEKQNKFLRFKYAKDMHSIWYIRSAEVEADIFTSKVTFYRVKKGFGFYDNALHYNGTNCKWLNVGTQSVWDKNIYLCTEFCLQENDCIVLGWIKWSCCFRMSTIVEYWPLIWFHWYSIWLRI